MKKISLYIIAVFSVALISVITSHASAAACSDSSPLGFTPWYHGLVVANGTSCDIKSPGNNISGFVWTIVLNLLDDFLRVVGYASVAYLIFGGFKYMTSKGSADGMAKAKTTILNAIVGLIISVASVSVITLVTGAL